MQVQLEQRPLSPETWQVRVSFMAFVMGPGHSGRNPTADGPGTHGAVPEGASEPHPGWQLLWFESEMPPPGSSG